MVLRDEVQLSAALEAFSLAHRLRMRWTRRFSMHLEAADITSIDSLASHCSGGSINDELELYDAPKEDLLDEATIESLQAFLPGPVGFQCFRLAQRVAEKVEKRSADTKYAHRSRNGEEENEMWHVPLTGKWIVNVDCGGLIRKSIEHVTKQTFIMSLSDRDFMRAKDFYCFFSTLPHTVMDPPFPKIKNNTHLVTKWRIVNDLRMVIPGDIIVYRPKGNAAGGAVFTTGDQQDIHGLLEAVKTAKVWSDLRLNGKLVTRNVAKDPIVREWVAQVKSDLAAIGLVTVQCLYDNLDSIQLKFKGKGFSELNKEIIDLIKQCYEATAENTGHIVFVSGPAVQLGTDAYRVRIVHSTSHGKRVDGRLTSGVQEYFRRFVLEKDEHGVEHWTRKQAEVKDAIDCQGNVEVLAARMCF